MKAAARLLPTLSQSLRPTFSRPIAIAGPSKLPRPRFATTLLPSVGLEEERVELPSNVTFEGFDEEAQGQVGRGLQLSATRLHHTPTSRSDPIILPISSLASPTPTLAAPSNLAISLPSDVFAQPLRRDILHRCVVWYLSILRQGSQSTKTRSTVAYSGRKLRQQKGTGKARVGDASSGIRRGGAPIFALHPRDHALLLPRKIRNLGLKIALSSKLSAGCLRVVQDLNEGQWSGTAAARRALCDELTAVEGTEELQVLNRFGNVNDLSVLFLYSPDKAEKDVEEFMRVVRNLPGVEVMATDEVGVWEVLKYKWVVLEGDGVDALAGEAGLEEGLVGEEGSGAESQVIGEDAGVFDTETEMDRIRTLENQVSSIQNTLSDLVTTLRAGMASSFPNGGGGAPITSTDYRTAAMNQIAPQHALQTSAHISPYAIPTPTPFADPMRRQPSLNLYNPYEGSSSNLGYSSSRDMFEAPKRPPPPPSYPWGAASSLAVPPRATQHMSLPPSRAGSEGPEDILAPDEIINPLGAMSNMAGLVEAAVERAREEQAAKVSGKRPESNNLRDDSRGPAKKARFSGGKSDPSMPMVVETLQAKSRGQHKKIITHVHAFPDAIHEGYVSEEEARDLFSIFYTGSSNFISCYDRNVDTWESLKIRSPFSISAMIMVGARVRDGGGPMSEVQRLCKEHVQRIGEEAAFEAMSPSDTTISGRHALSGRDTDRSHPSNDRRVCLLRERMAARRAGHAVRMAIDMGINTAFDRLLKSGMGKGKTPDELEEERPLVVHSRVWFCLYLMEHQMAYGMGRPAILREDNAIQNCRRLLEHPFSITSDARLVSTVELMALRGELSVIQWNERKLMDLIEAPLHIELTASPDVPLSKTTMAILKEANVSFDNWEKYWDRVLCEVLRVVYGGELTRPAAERFGKGRGDFYRESIEVQRQYAELFVNSQLLRGIRERTDVINMPSEKRDLAIRAMRNAQHCLDICLRGENYRNGLRYAVHYTHVCAAFAASFLIRIARLFPNELNLKKTAKDVEELASVLASVPAGRYARSLRLILRRARRAKVIPAASVFSSPKKDSAPLPVLKTEPSRPFSPSQMVNPSYLSAGAGAASHSPASLLYNATQIINDSPQSNELLEFDFLFAQETLERAGLSLEEGDQLPLFLDGQSLGASLGQTGTTNFVGMENYFLPIEIDDKLASSSSLSGQNPAPGSNEFGAGGDVWW
ncbi:large subunit ribosomal protein L4, partial [Tremellales sp. Uapishka_1]